MACHSAAIKPVHEQHCTDKAYSIFCWTMLNRQRDLLAKALKVCVKLVVLRKSWRMKKVEGLTVDLQEK